MSRKGIVLINTFTPRPGKLDEFLAVQTAALKNLGPRIDGWRGSRLHRATDGSRAVMMTVFDSVEHHRRWIESGAFAEHRDKVLPLIDNADPQYYEIVHEAGTI